MSQVRLRVREAVAADIGELVRLRAVMVARTDDDPDPEWRRHAWRWFGDHLRRDDWTCVVAGGGPGEPLVACGLAGIVSHLPGPDWPDGRRGYVAGMCTEPEMRRCGYARQIMTELLTWLRGRGVEVVELSASPDGAPLYREFGFTEAAHPSMRLRWQRVPTDPRSLSG